MAKLEQGNSSARGFSWLIAVLLLLVMFINYLDRQTLSVLAPYLPAGLKMSKVSYGEIQGLFLLSYALAMPLAGWVVDRLGTRAGLSLTVAIWSVIEFLHGTAHSVASLRTYRFLLGIPEAGAWPAVGKVAAEHAAPHARATLIGIAMFGLGMGTTMTPPVVSWLTHNDPSRWNWVFYITGLAGLAWIVLWLVFYRSQPSAATAARLPEPRTPWIKLLGDRQVLALMLIRTFSDSMWWFYLYWIPPFLEHRLGLDLHHMGIIGWIPYFFASIGSAVGGYASGWLIRRGWEPVKARKAILWVAACVVPFTSFVAGATSVTSVIALLAIATFFAQAFFANIFALPADMFSPEKVASVVGLNVLTGSLAGSFTIWAAGHIVERFSYGPLFVLVAFFLPMGAICAQIVLRSTTSVPRPAPVAGF